ncbi:octopamine receptor-like [Actinia tenebrosa]|uniref:Octopamine receptor-like n=1 Tax=Actinia tenebrosa TaxID=6105 RepID=A0A6P8HBX1_ACTTE|nr:octopamine receptor-like [Actinia tenebrosa]
MSNSSGIGYPNGSYPSYPQLVPWYLNEYNVSMVILYVLVITATIVGNLLIIAAVCINIKLRKNVASYFIVSLAVADLCTGCFSMSFDLETFITYGRWKHGEVFCSIWSTAYLITVPISIWNLFVLSIERYKTLKNPWDRFRVTPFMTPRRALLVIAMLWSYSLTFAMIPLMGWNYEPPKKIAHFCSFKVSPSYAIFSAFLNFYFPMFAMCFIYYKIYEIARTQYLMPTGLAVKGNSMPSRTAGNEQLPEEPQQRQSMNCGRRYDYESCKASGSFKNDVNEKGVSNLGLQIENADKGDRTKTFIEVMEDSDNGLNQIDQNDEGITQDIKDDGHNESDMVEDVSQARLEEVTLQVKEEEEEEEKEEEEEEEEEEGEEEKEIERGKIPEESPQKKDQSTDLTNLDDPEDLVDQNIQNVEEKKNSAGLCDVEENHHGLALPIQAVASQQDAKTEDNNEEQIEKDVSQDTTDVTPKDEPLDLEDQKKIAKSCSTSEDKYDDGTCCSGEQQEGVGGFPDKSPSHAVVSIEMKTYLRNKVLTNEDREKSSSRDSLQSTCTLQSTLPDGSSSVLARGEHMHEISSSRDTLNSQFESMEYLTKRRKIYVKNRKAARTICIIVSAFLVCWMPYNTFSIVMNICQKRCYAPLVFQVSQILLYFGYLNSILNPIIFSYQNVQFRKAYRMILRKVFPCLKISVN